MNNPHYIVFGAIFFGAVLVVWAILGTITIVRNLTRAHRRKAAFAQVLREAEFMRPIFAELHQEILSCWHAGDYCGFEKARRRLVMLDHRWKREVTDKLNLR